MRLRAMGMSDRTWFRSEEVTWQLLGWVRRRSLGKAPTWREKQNETLRWGTFWKVRVDGGEKVGQKNHAWVGDSPCSTSGERKVAAGFYSKCSWDPLDHMSPLLAFKLHSFTPGSLTYQISSWSSLSLSVLLCLLYKIQICLVLLKPS